MHITDITYMGKCPECGAPLFEGIFMDGPATITGWTHRRGSCSVHGDATPQSYEPDGFVPGEVQEGKIVLIWSGSATQ